jgi:hypothetical protein
MEPDTLFQIGDTVKTIGVPTYSGNVPINTHGTVIKIRKRYSGTSNEYIQYKITFNDYKNGDDLTNLYEGYDLVLSGG